MDIVDETWTTGRSEMGMKSAESTGRGVIFIFISRYYGGGGRTSAVLPLEEVIHNFAAHRREKFWGAKAQGPGNFHLLDRTFAT